MAFKITKSYSVIQALYHTNQNILVCAPTSVGQTNIAMLTVLREQQNNIEGGVSCKDQLNVEHARVSIVSSTIYMYNQLL